MARLLPFKMARLHGREGRRKGGTEGALEPFPSSRLGAPRREQTPWKNPTHTHTRTQGLTYTHRWTHTVTHGHCHSRTHTHAHALPPTEHAHTHISYHMSREIASQRPQAPSSSSGLEAIRVSFRGAIRVLEGFMVGFRVSEARSRFGKAPRMSGIASRTPTDCKKV